MYIFAKQCNFAIAAQVMNAEGRIEHYNVYWWSRHIALYLVYGLFCKAARFFFIKYSAHLSSFATVRGRGGALNCDG